MTNLFLDILVDRTVVGKVSSHIVDCRYEQDEISLVFASVQKASSD